MIPFKCCCLCLQPSNEFLQDFKSVLSDFMPLFRKFQPCNVNCIRFNELTICNSCWIYYLRIRRLKHQLRLKREICDADKSFLRSKIRLAQGSAVERGAEHPTATSKERNPTLLSLLTTPVEDHPRYSPQVPRVITFTDGSDGETFTLTEGSDLVAPTTDIDSITGSSAEREPVEATSDNTSEASHSESEPDKSNEDPTDLMSVDTSDFDSESEAEPEKHHRVTSRSKRIPKVIRKSCGWRIQSSDVEKLSETDFTYMNKYPFIRTDIGFKCGLCSVVSNFYIGSSCDSYNMLRHIHEWHIDTHRVRATKVHQRFIEIAPNRFQYGKYKVELIDGNYRCEECGELSAVRAGRHKAANIMKHITGHHENPSRSSVCEFCGKVYRSPFGLSEHKRVKHSTNTNRFPCSECDKTFFSRSMALTHHKRAHEGLYKEKFICEICGKECSQKLLLKTHIAFVHNGQKIKCNDCDKTFGSQLALKIHRHCHVGTKFTCDICGMDFTQAFSVTRHKRTAHPQ